MIISPTKKIHFPGKPYNNSDIFFSDYDNYKRTITASAIRLICMQKKAGRLTSRPACIPLRLLLADSCDTWKFFTLKVFKHCASAC